MSNDSTSNGAPSPERITVPKILSRKATGQKITAITAYDVAFARLFDEAGVELILVGDSLGSVVQGHSTTLPVTLEEVIYHTRCVTRGVEHALVLADLPFLSYQVSIEQAVLSAGRLIKEGGASAVKLEGGEAMFDTIERLVAIDIPVVGHVGLTPQSYHRMGGHRVQGKTPGSRDHVLADARAVADAGAFAIVLEGIPVELAHEITAELSIPTIGIGAGKECDGQILVMHDLLGLTPGPSPKFVKRFAELGHQVKEIAREYCAEVKGGSYPAEEHTYHDSTPPSRKPNKKKLSLV